MRLALLALLVSFPALAQRSDPDFRPVAITENGVKVGSGYSVRGRATHEKTGITVDAKMVAACVGRETKVYWSFDGGTFAPGLKVQYRIDLGASGDIFKPLAVQVANDRLAFGMYQNSGTAFLRHLAHAIGALEIKVGETTLLYSTVQPEAAIKAIAGECGWKL